jgi:hypothetical protein
MPGFDFNREWGNQRKRIMSVLQVLQRTNPRELSRQANRKVVAEKRVERAMEARFATQGASGGRPWPGLKASTIRDRARNGYGPVPILVRTGTLRDAVSKGSEKPDANGIRHKFRDGPGPTYGKRKATRLSVYAPALDARRPFLQDIRGPEAKGILARFWEIVRNFYSSALDGKLS